MRIPEWTSDFALGIDEIDEQHRSLIGMIGALDTRADGDSTPETVRRLLAQLSDYVRDHFGFEERLMGGGGCSPDLVARHFGEHAYFRSVLKDLATDFEKGRRNITLTLVDYLVHWFLHHIVVVDRVMAQQINATEPDLAARVAAASLRKLADQLTESERHQLGQLRHANEELEQQMLERTMAWSARNSRLEAELSEMSALVERLSKQPLP